MPLRVLWFCLPRPLPTAEGIGAMPWWAPLGGVIGAFAVIAGLLFVDRVGAGTFAGLTITANILMSLVIDHLGLFGVQQHSMGLGRTIGAILMVAGIFAISKF
jgi:transporter family-2 protein